MSQALFELSLILVKTNHGELCSKIFKTLAQSGRLTRAQLRQRFPIPRRRLRQALLTLTSQHILLYARAPLSQFVHYQIDWNNTYAIIRANRISCLVEDRYGKAASKIITNLLQMGQATVSELARALDPASSSKRKGGAANTDGHVNGNGLPNGDSADHPTDDTTNDRITTDTRLHTLLRRLLKLGFLIKVGKRSYIPGSDLQQEIEEVVIREQFPDGKVTGPKKKIEFRTAVNELKRKWRDAEDYSEFLDVENGGSLQPTSKRIKLNGGRASAVRGSGDIQDGVPKLPDNMVLRVNHAQCTLALRSQHLQRLAEKSLGSTTAGVYGALLQVLETKVISRDRKWEQQDNDDEEDTDSKYAPVAHTNEVLEFLGQSFDLSGSVKDPNELDKQPTGKKKGKLGYQDEDHRELGIKTEIVSDDEDDHPTNGFHSGGARFKRFNLVEDHLNILYEHEKGFCVRASGQAHGSWRVDFPALSAHLINDLIDRTVTDCHGKAYTRIIRLLRDKGKLDDKQVTAISMMKPKDVRSIMTQLQFSGLIEVQEVPKDATRQPARTIFLWFHDPERVQSTLLQRTYKSMARALQRLKAEREHFKNAIEKAEQTGKNQESLNQNEREAVMQWRELEERIKMEVQRMDEDVALLRDFSENDTSLAS